MAQQPAPPGPGQDLSIEEALGRAQAHWNAGQADQAELLCQRVLAAWPGQCDAHHLMGLMAHAYGNLDLALQHVRLACQAPRAPALYFSNLAEMCRQKQLLEEAERAARNAVAMNGNLAAAWNNLGIILQEAGKFAESVTCLERVAGMQGDNAEVHNNLANTYKRLGRLDKSEAHYMRALELHPNYAEAHSNLSTLLNDRGDLERAAAEARLAIDINPRLADAYLNIAAVELTRRRLPEALRWLEALLAFAPLNAAGLAARATVLKDAGQLDEALASVQQAVSLAQDNADAHNTLGQILQALGRFDEAGEAYRKAIALPGIAAENARVNQGVMLMEVGRKAEAMAAFDGVLVDYPRSASAWFNRADLKKFTKNDPDIPAMTKLLEDQEQTLNDRMSLHFALGKAHLDAGTDTDAFRHFASGNRMKRETFTFDSAATAAWMKNFPKIFTPALLKKRGKAGHQSTMPIFVVGMPRSGTTLIEQILAAHPSVTGAGELSNLQRLVDTLPNYPLETAKLEDADFARLGRDYIAQTAPLAKGRPFMVDKMPANFLHAGLIRLILPQARIIHCRRDPVDTCLSCYSKLFTAEQAFAYDLSELGQFHVAYQELMAHWRKVLPAESFIEIDYEAVVADTEGETRRLLERLGLPWDEACLRFFENDRPIRTASVNQVRQPIYKSSSGRWKRHAAHLGQLLGSLGIDAP